MAVALLEDGSLDFRPQKGGASRGQLRLASTEPPESWHLCGVDAATIALALGDWLVVIDVETRKPKKRVRMRAKVTCMTADASLVVCGLEDGWLQAVVPGASEPCGSFEAHSKPVEEVAFADGKVVSKASATERTWDRPQVQAAQPAAPTPITAVAARGAIVVSADKKGRVRVTRGDRAVGTSSVGEAAIAVDVAKSDAVFVAGARVVVRAPRPWDAPRPIPLRSPPVAFSADDSYAFAGTAAGVVDVYDFAAGKHLTSWSLTDGGVTAVTRATDRYVVAGSGALDGRVFVVDAVDSKVAHRMEPHDDAFGVTCLAADPRGRIVASGSDDGSVALLDPAKGKVLARLRMPETPSQVAFEPTGRRFVCVFADGTTALVTLQRGGASVERLAFTGATCAAWGDQPVFGFNDGRVERLPVDALKPS